MTAEERFKWLLANALERNCVLEAALEQAQAEALKVPDLEARILDLEATRDRE